MAVTDTEGALNVKTPIRDVTDPCYACIPRIKDSQPLLTGTVAHPYSLPSTATQIHRRLISFSIQWSKKSPAGKKHFFSVGRRCGFGDRSVERSKSREHRRFQRAANAIVYQAVSRLVVPICEV